MTQLQFPFAMFPVQCWTLYTQFCECYFSRGCHFVFFIRFIFDHSFSMSVIFLNYYLGASLVKTIHW